MALFTIALPDKWPHYPMGHYPTAGAGYSSTAKHYPLSKILSIIDFPKHHPKAYYPTAGAGYSSAAKHRPANEFTNYNFSHKYSEKK